MAAAFIKPLAKGGLAVMELMLGHFGTTDALKTAS
jgi:hypothetical protein